MNVIQRTAAVKAGGRIEIEVPDLPAGIQVEVFVYPPLTDEEVAERVRDLRGLLTDTRAATCRLGITEEDVVREIAAVRAERR